MFFKPKKSAGKRIFLDYASTTPIEPMVRKAMQEYEDASFANPSALYHEALAAKEKVAEARENIAGVLNCQKNDIIFTSGGTEANNLALLGVFEKKKEKDFVPHVVTTVIEHPAILEVCREIESRGGEVTYLPVSGDGLVFAKDVLAALTPQTVLVSIAYANNEIGTVQPIKEIGRALKEYRRENGKEKNSFLPYFHTDACQAACFMPLDVQKLGVDMMTLDGIKMYGPRGAGILYVKNSLEISPILFGGGQERGVRSGTENVSAIVGLAKALEIAEAIKEKEFARLLELRDYAIEQILKHFPAATLNGSQEFRLPNNINVCFPGLDAEFAVISLDVAGVSASYSSSCRTLKEDSSSYVVESLGKPDCKSSSLRFTFGRDSSFADIDALLRALINVITQ